VRGFLLVVEGRVFPCIVDGHVVYSSQKDAGGDEAYGRASRPVELLEWSIRSRGCSFQTLHIKPISHRFRVNVDLASAAIVHKLSLLDSRGGGREVSPITTPAAPMLKSVRGIVLDCERIVGVGMAAFVEPLFFSWKYRTRAAMSPIKRSEWEEGVEPG